MATATDGDTVVLENVSWELYTQLRDDPARQRVRMTYYRGSLILMSPSGPHERINRLLSDFVTAWCDVHGLPNANFGSTTYRRETRRSGLEPDTCFYFEQEPLVRGKEELDLTIDPPPDLAVEVDLRGWSAGRLLVYQELGVAEVWRTNGEWLRVYQWSEDGYVEIPSSRQLPGLLPDALLGFLQRRHEVESGALRAEFRAWAATQSPGT